jgi:hypothetical protein
MVSPLLASIPDTILGHAGFRGELSTMTTSLQTVSALGKLVFLLLESPEAVEEQKRVFRELLQSLGTGARRLVVDPTGISLDGAAFSMGEPAVAALHAHLLSLGIGEVRLPAGLLPAPLLTFLRLIAVAPGTYANLQQLTQRLMQQGADSIQVLPRSAANLSGLEVSPGEMLGRPASGQHGGGAPAKPEKEEDVTLKEIGPDALSEAKVGMMHFVTLEARHAGDLERVASHLSEAAQLDRATTDMLNELVTAGEVAASRGEWPRLLKAATTLIELEQKGGALAVHRAYGIALRRMVPRSVLENLARLAVAGPTRNDAITVFRRLGADATEVLLGLLAAAPTAPERRAYFNALTQMTEGTPLVIHMLSHDEWYVVRNVAELCGELKLEPAVAPLAKRMSHPDERVRRSVAGALARIGTPGTVEPLRQALRDKSPLVRLHAAQSLDGRKGRGLAMTLAVAVEEESQADVQREMLLALGRIGSPEALQAINRAAAPGGKLFKRKPQALRLTAIEALHAAGPAAVSHLKTLLEDEDPAIREAVKQAVTTLWEA